EEIPGRLFAAWDKMLQWQTQKRVHEGKDYEIDQFTLFFTTRIGPNNLPAEHRGALEEIIQENIETYPTLKALLTARFDMDDVSALYDQKFPEFLKLAVPKALVSRALSHDWSLDVDLSYRGFQFSRAPEGVPPYTMLHLVL